MENKNINNKNINKADKEKDRCKCCDSRKKEAAPDIMDMMLSGLLAGVALQALIDEVEDMPDAAPLDLLSKSDYERMDAYLEKHYGTLREYIDENYVALLMTLAQYEKVDFDAKIKAHIVHNIQNK